MPPVVYSTRSMMELEQFIGQTLCDQERLDQKQMIVKRSFVRRQQQIIGVVFRIESWQQRHCHAIWVEPEHRILFYNSAGTRFAEVKLAEEPLLEQMRLLQAG